MDIFIALLPSLLEYTDLLTTEKLINLDFLACYYHCIAVLLYLFLSKTLSYHWFYWLSILLFINFLIYKIFKIYWSAYNKKLINLNYVVWWYHHILVLLCLLLLTALSNIISCFKLLQFIDLLVTLFISLLEYTDLLITKKLINLDFLACCCQCIVILLCLLLLIVLLDIISFNSAFGYHQFLWPPTIYWFINYIIFKSFKIH